jgi:hypothetical protein
MSYSTSSLKVALGIAIVENKKLSKDQKIAVMEFVQNGTDAQIRHLALTGEVKYKFTLNEKKMLAEKVKKIGEGFFDDPDKPFSQSQLRHHDDMMATYRKQEYESRQRAIEREKAALENKKREREIAKKYRGET